MKRILQSIFALSLMLMATTAAFAQLPNGSVGPDWTKTDIEGNEHNMYSWLDDGYTVIMDVSATWCGPCWSYHTSGTLEEVWENHGPAGWEGVSANTTDDVMIFFIEGDDDTTLDDLNGTGSNTTGDWVTGTHYPIIDDAYDIFQLYECTYYPTMYTICPSTICTETGQISADAHYEFASQPLCSPATTGTDPALNVYTGDLATCGTLNTSCEIVNMGTEVLTAATITVNGCTTCPEEIEWTGSLETYEIENVDLGSFTVNAPLTLDIEITSADDNVANNSLSADIAAAAEATTWWFIDFVFDCWSQEVSWEVLDDGGSVVASGDYAAGMTDASESFGLPSTGCYSFHLYDTYGDGMNGSIWDSCDIDGTCNVYSASGAIFSYDGSSGVMYGENEDALSAAADANTVSIDENAATAVEMNVYPNPFSDVTNLEFTVANSAAVTMDVLNMLGEVVMTNDFGTLSNGSHRTELDFSSIEAGLYFINLNVDGVTSTTKVTLTK